jgi:hypothetical protein
MEFGVSLARIATSWTVAGPSEIVGPYQCIEKPIWTREPSFQAMCVDFFDAVSILELHFDIRAKRRARCGDGAHIICTAGLQQNDLRFAFQHGWKK